MSKEDVVKYVMETPYNANEAVLRGLLEDIEGGEGGSDDPSEITGLTLLGTFHLNQVAHDTLQEKILGEVELTDYSVLDGINKFFVKVVSDQTDGFTYSYNTGIIKIEEGNYSSQGWSTILSYISDGSSSITTGKYGAYITGTSLTNGKLSFKVAGKKANSSDTSVHGNLTILVYQLDV